MSSASRRAVSVGSQPESKCWPTTTGPGFDCCGSRGAGGATIMHLTSSVSDGSNSVFFCGVCFLVFDVPSS